MKLSQTAVWLVLLFALQPLNIKAKSFDESVLLRDVDNVLTLDHSGRLFRSDELARLRELLKDRDAEQVDRLVAARALIEVKINPEARVSVMRTATPMPPFRCDVIEPLLVRILNQGHITSTLTLRQPHATETNMITLGASLPHLSGAAVEYRLFTIKVDALTPVDVTLNADAGPGTEDLSLHSQLYLTLRCQRN